MYHGMCRTPTPTKHHRQPLYTPDRYPLPTPHTPSYRRSLLLVFFTISQTTVQCLPILQRHGIVYAIPSRTWPRQMARPPLTNEYKHTGNWCFALDQTTPTLAHWLILPSRPLHGISMSYSIIYFSFHCCWLLLIVHHQPKTTTFIWNHFCPSSSINVDFNRNANHFWRLNYRGHTQHQWFGLGWLFGLHFSVRRPYFVQCHCWSRTIDIYCD